MGQATPLSLTPTCQELGLERRAQKEDTAWLGSVAALRQAVQRSQPGCSTLSRRPAPRLYTPLGSAALPASLTRGRWASGPGRSPRVWPIASSQPSPIQHPVPGAMEPRAVADALETGEEDAVTEALRSFNREVRGIQLRRKFQEERKQRCARNSARVCVQVWQGARRWIVGWASGVSVVGQVYGRRGWALPYVQSYGCCFRVRSRPAALGRGGQVLPACGSEPPGSPCSIPRASPSTMPSRRTGR